MNLPTPLINIFLRLFVKRPLAKLKDPVTARARFDRLSENLCYYPPFSSLVDSTLSHNEQVVPVTWISSGTNDSGRVILFAHGGAHFMGSIKTHGHILAHIAGVAEAEAVLPEYGLTPEKTFPHGLNDMKTCYKALLTKGYDPAKITLGGDSSGGGLVFALMAWILEQGLPKPSCIFALSPWLDLTLSSESLQTMRDTEVVLPSERIEEARDVYVGNHDPADPSISPLFGSYPGCPPVRLHVGSHEVLRDDTLNMYNNLLDQNVEVSCRIYDDAPHVWHALRGLYGPADAALDDIGAFVLENS